MRFICNVERKYESDVIVIGGGTSGVFAAIAAARCGADVLLIEKNSILGGTITVSNVNFPGLFFAWGKQIISGPCWEAVLRTVNQGGAKIPEISFKPERHWYEQIRVNRFVYSTVLFDMCRENNIRVLTNSMLSMISEDENGVNGIITDKSGMAAFSAKTVIDATGDANAVSILGYPLQKSDCLQPATLNNHISGYDKNLVDEAELYEAYLKTDLPDHVDFNETRKYLKINKIDMHIPCSNAETSEGRYQLESDARAAIGKIYSMYKKVKGLENIVIDFVAEETGVRETCRIIGEDTITSEDYLNGKIYEDAICFAFYPIDLHILKGIKQNFLKENTVPTIPYGALIPKSSHHILAVGRCISSDRDANSAIRVQAVCMATGQAAGCAAALCSKHNIEPREVEYNELVECLSNIGAIVPRRDLN